MITAEHIFYLSFTCLFVFSIGFYSLLGNADYMSPDGMLEIFNLIRFSKENLSKEVFESKIPKLITHDNFGNEHSKFGKFISKYKEFYSGKVFSYKELNENGGFRNIFYVIVCSIILPPIVILVSPFMAISIARNDSKERINKESIILLTHPLERQRSMMQIIGLIASSVILLFVSGFSILSEMVYFIAFTWALISVIASLFFCCKLALNQIRWKNGWKELLDIIIQKATIERSYDLHNRAILLKQSVEKYPDIPFSEVQKVMVILFAFLQFFVPRIVDFFNLENFRIDLF